MKEPVSTDVWLLVSLIRTERVPCFTLNGFPMNETKLFVSISTLLSRIMTSWLMRFVTLCIWAPFFKRFRIVFTSKGLEKTKTSRELRSSTQWICSRKCYKYTLRPLTTLISSVFFFYE